MLIRIIYGKHSVLCVDPGSPSLKCVWGYLKAVTKNRIKFEVYFGAFESKIITNHTIFFLNTHFPWIFQGTLNYRLSKNKENYRIRSVNSFTLVLTSFICILNTNIQLLITSAILNIWLKGFPFLVPVYYSASAHLIQHTHCLL